MHKSRTLMPVAVKRKRKNSNNREGSKRLRRNRPKNLPQESPSVEVSKSQGKPKSVEANAAINEQKKSATKARRKGQGWVAAKKNLRSQVLRERPKA